MRRASSCTSTPPTACSGPLATVGRPPSRTIAYRFGHEWVVPGHALARSSDTAIARSSARAASALA